MLQVTRVSHATFETPDVERQLEYQVNVLGLSPAERGPDGAFMKTALDQLAVVLNRGDTPRCTGIAFQVNPALSIDGIRKKLTDAGVHSELRNGTVPGIGETLSFKDRQGTTIDVSAEAHLLAEDRSLKGFVPLKLGHLAFKAPDLHAMVKFYSDVLGFRVSDWRQRRICLDALWAGSSHRKFCQGRCGEDTSHRVRAGRSGRNTSCLRLPGSEQIPDHLGAGPPCHWRQRLHISSGSGRSHHRALC